MKKRRSYDQEFRSDKTYKLCFPDGIEINTFPGSTEVFTLEKYKEDLGKTYARITLFTCPLVDTSDSEPEPEPELEPEETWSDLESDDWLNDIPNIAQGSHYKYLFFVEILIKDMNL